MQELVGEDFIMPIILYEGKGEVSTYYVSQSRKAYHTSGFVLLQNREFNFPHSKYCCRQSKTLTYCPTNPASANHPLTPENGQEGPCLAFGYKSFSVPTLLQYTAKNAFFSPLKVELIQNVQNGVKSCLKQHSYFLHPVFHEIFFNLYTIPKFRCQIDTTRRRWR